MTAPDDKDARIARLVELEAKATRAPWNSGGIRPTTVEKGTVHVDVDQPYEKYVVRAIYPTPQGRCTQLVAEMLTTARHEGRTRDGHGGAIPAYMPRPLGILATAANPFTLSAHRAMMRGWRGAAEELRSCR